MEEKRPGYNDGWYPETTGKDIAIDIQVVVVMLVLMAVFA